MTKAVVPTDKKAGTHTGRVTVRKTGSFNIQTEHGAVQGIPRQYGTVIQRGDGDGYHLTSPINQKGGAGQAVARSRLPGGRRAIPPGTRRTGYPAQNLMKMSVSAAGHARKRVANWTMGVLAILLLSLVSQGGRVAAQQDSQAGRQTLDRIVAVVNDDVIMHSELEQRVKDIGARLSARGETLPAPEELTRLVLDQMVVEAIQLQMAEEANLEVDATDLNRQLREIAESNGLGLQAFADRLESEGMTLARMRQELGREMLIRRVQQRELGQRISVSERDIDRLIETQGAGLAEGEDPEARRRQARQRLMAQRANAALEVWLNEIRADAFVDIRLP